MPAWWASSRSKSAISGPASTSVLRTEPLPDSLPDLRRARVLAGAIASEVVFAYVERAALLAMIHQIALEGQPDDPSLSCAPP